MLALGSIGLGVYEVVSARQNNRALIFATIPVRLLFAVMGWIWGGVVVYEAGVAVVCGVALFG
jgi:hypothetical protein